MFGKMFGPKHTFKNALLILEKGLRSGEIVPSNGLNTETTAVVDGVSIRQSVQVYLSARPVFYPNLRWSDRVASAGSR